MGFFTEDELTIGGSLQCSSCGLDKCCTGPHLSVLQEYRQTDILIILPRPTKENDKNRNTPWLSDQLLQVFGGEYEAAVEFAVACYSPIKDKGISECRSRLWKTIKACKPKLIFCCGEESLKALYEQRIHLGEGLTLEQVRGFVIPDPDFRCWVAPVYTPEYVEKMSWDKVVSVIWRQDIKNARDSIGKSLPDYPPPLESIRLVTNKEKIGAFLDEIQKRKATIAFDYETTGLKPHREKHHIRTVAVAVSPKLAYAFPLDGIEADWLKILWNTKIRKIAHNLQFEDTWGHTVGNAQTVGWWCDTRLVAHLLDGRRKATSLKFQAFIRLGQLTYTEEVGRFLKASGIEESKYGENAYNKVDQAPLPQLLKYNAMDALLTFRLYAEFKKMGVIPE